MNNTHYTYVKILIASLPILIGATIVPSNNKCRDVEIIFGCHITNYKTYKKLLSGNGEGWDSITLKRCSDELEELASCFYNLHTIKPTPLDQLVKTEQILIDEYDCSCASTQDSLTKNMLLKVFSKEKFDIYYSFVRADNIDSFSKNCRHTCYERGDMIIVDKVTLTARFITVYFERYGDMSITKRYFFVDSEFTIHVFDITQHDDFIAEDFNAKIIITNKGKIIVRKN